MNKSTGEYDKILNEVTTWEDYIKQQGMRNNKFIHHNYQLIVVQL